MHTSTKLQSLGNTIFSEMTQLAQKHASINLGQGFPDFEGPSSIVEAAVEALRDGHNQYARSAGEKRLVEAIAAQRSALYGLTYDPMTEVGVYTGCTEGLMATMLGLLNPGDEVVMFEPVYDSYPACMAMAQARARYVPLRFPDFALDVDRLKDAINEKTKLILVNTPHNPTGKVFTKEELQQIADLCQQRNLLAVTDEVYEHLIYDQNQHVPLAALPGMRERTLSLSSTGKTYSLTGWKIGWATGPAEMIAAAQAAHQYITFSTATPLQHATAFALQQLGPTFFGQLRAEYTERRDRLLACLREAGLIAPTPQGAYYLLADFTARFDGDDVAFAKHLTTRVGVTAIPPSFFYPQHPEEGRRLIRFAFCKQLSTLDAAIERLQKL
ncbi:MAG: aminotransferase class I/II-fold pyridoxal phosphate-dependent enzyme [Myxococcota bacterium]